MCLLGVTAELNSEVMQNGSSGDGVLFLLFQDRSPQIKLNPERRFCDLVLRRQPKETLTEYKVNAG